MLVTKQPPCRVRGKRKRVVKFVQELELKVELRNSDLDRLTAEFVASDISVGPAATKELRTAYFDTPERDLHAAGVSLRLLRQDGG